MHQPRDKDLTRWGREMHLCFSKLTIIGSHYNGLSPDWCQAIIWTIPGILPIGHVGTNFSEILIEIQTFSFKKMHLKMLSAKWRLSILSRPECVNVSYVFLALTHQYFKLTGMYEIIWIVLKPWSVILVESFRMLWLGADGSTVKEPLTHWGLNRMATFCRQHFQMHFLDTKILIQILLKFVCQGPVDKMSALLWNL